MNEYRLTLLELIWLFRFAKFTVHEAAEATDRSSATVIEWSYMSCQVFSATSEHQHARVSRADRRVLFLTPTQIKSRQNPG